MKGSKCVMIVNLNMGTSFEENVGVLRYASLAHEIEALPASELGGTMSRSSSGDVKSDGMEFYSFFLISCSRDLWFSFFRNFL